MTNFKFLSGLVPANNISMKVKTFIRYLLIFFITVKSVILLISIFNYFDLLSADSYFSCVSGNESQNSNVHIPSDSPSFVNWLNNVSPIFVGLTVYRLLGPMKSLSPAGRNFATISSVAISVGCNLADKVLIHSIGYNRFISSTQEIIRGEQITKTDSFLGINPSKVSKLSEEVVDIKKILLGLKEELQNRDQISKTNWSEVMEICAFYHKHKENLPPEVQENLQSASADFVKNLQTVFTEEKLREVFKNVSPTQALDLFTDIENKSKDVAKIASSSSKSASSEVTSISDSTVIGKFIPDSNSSEDFFISLYENLYFSLLSVLKPIALQGYFDDLIGQRLFLEFILLTISICTLILFLVFILNLVILLNKDKILAILPKNKFFNFFITIEFILIKYTVILSPLFIILGLFVVIKSHIWLMSHTIPYESLGIDLHQYLGDSPVDKNIKNITPLLVLTSDFLYKKSQRHTFFNPIIGNTYNNSIIDKKYISTTKNLRGSSNKVNLYSLHSPIYKELITILNSEEKTIDTQVKIENLLLNQGSKISKYTSSESVNHKVLLVLKANQDSIEKSIKNLQSNLTVKDKKETEACKSYYYEIISNTKIGYFTNIMFARVLSIIKNEDLASTKSSRVEVSISLGQELVNNFLYEKYKKFKQIKINTEVSYYSWKKDNIKLFKELEDTQLRFNLGNTLISILIDLELIVENLEVLGKENKLTVLIPGVKLKNYGKKDLKNLPQLIPTNIPMIVPPKKYIWDSQKSDYVQLGGYYLNDVSYASDVILPNWQLATNSKILSKNDICDMVNILNSVPFKINVEVLDFILKNNEKYNFYTDLNFEHPLKLKNKLTIKENKELQSFQSKKDLELNILCLATLFREVDCFYFPVRLDFRGRVYCITEYLNYQGIELAKGLLKFFNTEKIYLTDSKSIDFLKIYGANSFGNKIDKKSFNDRVLWVENNLENIVNFENGILLNQAENKIIFLSFCFEFKKYIQALKDNNTYFMSDLPIQLDATCNGFQHLTLLIEDIVLSQELNLNKSNNSDIPKDFYSFIGLKLKEFFNIQLKNSNSSKLSNELLQSYEKLATIDIHRSLIKKAVMTIPYNASALSIVNYIKDEFDVIFTPKDKKLSNSTNLLEASNNQEIVPLPESKSKKASYNIQYIHKKNKNIILQEIDFDNLRRALNKVLFFDFPRLKALSKYLKDIANVANILNIPILWILPTGLVISQKYFNTKVIRVKPNVYSNKTVSLTILDKKGINKNKQKIALMPNLVHSLDAASLCLVIIEFFKYNNSTSFYSIHDCFAVHCNKIDILDETLKSAYCVIYSNKKYLLEFDSNFRNHIVQLYGEEYVKFNEEEEVLEITIVGNNTKIIAFPSIKKIIPNDSQDNPIDFKNSAYLVN